MSYTNPPPQHIAVNKMENPHLQPQPQPLSLSQASTPMSIPSSYLSPPMQSGWNTPATSLTISPPTTPSPALPEEYLAASPIETAQPSKHLGRFEYAQETETPLHNVSSKGKPRLSRPVPMMRLEYDTVVVGSGYGGGVAASRAARAGEKVCILEFGEERWPGEFPSDAIHAGKELYMTGNAARTGEKRRPPPNIPGAKKNGLYRLVLGEGQNMFVGCGLGGTSLLNANVFLEPDEATLRLPLWPEEIRSNPRVLRPYYDLAARMLEPVQYPHDAPELPKLKAFEEQARLMGWHDRFSRVWQTTTFHDRINNTGVEMKASKLTGQDSTGINDGSKNSTLVNYVADAWNWGAEIFCECEVRYVKKAPDGGYIVYFAWHGDKRDCFKDEFYSDLMWVKAKNFVFLGAGAMGTTEILLRSKEHGLQTSSMVGKNMSGNGDILGFGYNMNQKVNSMGKENPDPKDTPVGPTITGIIDMRGTPNPLDGFVIEEGTVPEALQGALPIMFDILSGGGIDMNGSVRDSITSLGKLAARTGMRFAGKPLPDDPLSRTQIYLIMSHDSNEAGMLLEDDKPYLHFFGVGRQEHVLELNETLRRITEVAGGTFIDSPFYSDFFGKEQISVHPIGGAVYSYDGTGTNGVTNHMGQVFVGEGTEVHEGLVCMDASIIPRALAANPFATITALAERNIDLLFQKTGRKVDWSPNGPLNLFGKPRVCHPLTDDMRQSQRAIQAARTNQDEGARFSEIMQGHIYIGKDIEDFAVAESVARGAASAAKFYLSVDAWSTRTLVDSADHAAMLTGTFSHGALSQDPFMVLRGLFKLFSQDMNTPDTKNLVYDFDMVGTNGKKIHFNGYKVVDSTMAFSVSQTWKATTILNVTLSDENGLLGRGRLHVGWRNFASQLMTIGVPVNNPDIPPSAPAPAVTSSNTQNNCANGCQPPTQAEPTPSQMLTTTVNNKVKKTKGPRQFVTFFAKQTAQATFKPFASFIAPKIDAAGYFPKLGPSDSIPVTAVDGVVTEMKKWQPVGGGQQKFPILFVPGAAVDHQIFALPTIEVNAVDYFIEQGYTVYAMNHRVGRNELSKDPRHFTVYDARLDLQAALKYVYETHRTKVYAIAHCAGSLCLASGILDGSIPTHMLQGITASQVFMNPIFTSLNNSKAQLPAGFAWKALTNTTYFNTTPTRGDKVSQRVLDQALRFYPVDTRAEMCSSRTCHRSSLIFGRLWTHKNLNEATHSHLPSFLGGINMNCLTHLMEAGKRGEALDNNNNSLVTPENLERLRGVNILFIHGEENAVYKPESTGKSYDMMRNAFGDRRDTQYELFTGRGHLDCWMGTTSNRDVYPRVLAHLKEVEIIEA